MFLSLRLYNEGAVNKDATNINAGMFSPTRAVVKPPAPQFRKSVAVRARGGGAPG